nr:uncharacterized protein LOC129257975 [Lytechinus pictus]
MDATYFDFSNMDLDVFQYKNDPAISGYPPSPEDSPLFESPDTHFFDEDEAAVMGLKLSYHSCGSPASANSSTSDDMPVTPLSSGAEAESYCQMEKELETGQTAFINTSHMYLELLHQLEQSESRGMLERETSVQRKQTSTCGAAVNQADVIQTSKSSPRPADEEQSPTCQKGALNAPPLPVKSTSQPSPRAAVLEAAASTSSKVRQDTNNFSVAKINVTKVGVKRKAAQGKVEAKRAKKGGEDSTPISRNEKNAIAARENRLKKKEEFEELKRNETLLQEENESLRKENSDYVQKIKGLEQEVEYYKSVLCNQSALATILDKINPQSKLKLSSSVGVSDQEETVGVKKVMSGGVCLHLNGTDTSLEWCSKCSMNAQKSFQS